jgi:hypothetical protein
MSRGCGYDHILSAWLPPHCHDAELSTLFDEMGTADGHRWVYYDHPNRTRELTKLQVSMKAGIDPNMGAISVTEDWHMSHCLYMWLRLARKDLTGILMTPRDDDLEHVMHCVNVIWGNLKQISYMQEVVAITGVFMFPEHRLS